MGFEKTIFQNAGSVAAGLGDTDFKNKKTERVFENSERNGHNTWKKCGLGALKNL